MHPPLEDIEMRHLDENGAGVHESHNTARLRRAQGHLAKVVAMTEANGSCVEIIQQLSAVIAALGTAKNQILQSHINSCLKPALKQRNSNLLSEIEELLDAAMRL